MFVWWRRHNLEGGGGWFTCWRRLNFEGGGGLTSNVAEAVSFFYLWWRLVFFGGGHESVETLSTVAAAA